MQHGEQRYAIRNKFLLLDVALAALIVRDAIAGRVLRTRLARRSAVGGWVAVVLKERPLSPRGNRGTPRV